MTQRKLIIEPIRRNMLCEMIGCKNKRDYKLQRAKSDAIYVKMFKFMLNSRYWKMS